MSFRFRVVDLHEIFYSGRPESDWVYLLPKQAYYRYTTARRTHASTLSVLSFRNLADEKLGERINMLHSKICLKRCDVIRKKGSNI